MLRQIFTIPGCRFPQSLGKQLSVWQSWHFYNCKKSASGRDLFYKQIWWNTGNRLWKLRECVFKMMCYLHCLCMLIRREADAGGLPVLGPCWEDTSEGSRYSANPQVFHVCSQRSSPIYFAGEWRCVSPLQTLLCHNKKSQNKWPFSQNFLTFFSNFFQNVSPCHDTRNQEFTVKFPKRFPKKNSKKCLKLMRNMQKIKCRIYFF